MYETEGPSCTSALLIRVSPPHQSDVLHCVPARPDRLTVSRLPLVELPPGRAVLSVRASESRSNATVLGFPFPFAGVAPGPSIRSLPPARRFALTDIRLVARSVVSRGWPRQVHSIVLGGA